MVTVLPFFSDRRCLWVGVFTDVIMRSYINSARDNGMGSACAVNNCDFHNTLPIGNDRSPHF